MLRSRTTSRRHSQNVRKFCSTCSSPFPQQRRNNHNDTNHACGPMSNRPSDMQRHSCMLHPTHRHRHNKPQPQRKTDANNDTDDSPFPKQRRHNHNDANHNEDNNHICGLLSSHLSDMQRHSCMLHHTDHQHNKSQPRWKTDADDDTNNTHHRRR